MDLSKDYYIGLDCGTESVGFAVTDTNYKVLKFHGKSMWGSHLFEEANTAAARRTNRAARRRYLRKKERIDLLQGLFDDEISKIDPTFFLRLNDSAYHLEHKHIKQKNSLFNDPDYSDKNFYKEYPTIFHLRKSLYEGKTKADPRLLYLAIHHILKNRGHFLLPGTGMKSVISPASLVQAIKDSTSSVFDDFEFRVESEKDLEEAIKIRKSKDRIEALSRIIDTSDEKIKKLLVRALVGYAVKPMELFDNEEYKELPSIQFSKNTFEESDLPTLEDALDDDQYLLVVNLKGLYDWGLLINILSGRSTIAEAKVDLWNSNKEQLALLKKALKNHTSKKEYEDFFHQDSEGSFSRYIGKIHNDKKAISVKRTTTDDFYKKIKKLIGNKPEDPESLKVLEEIENGTFMPLLISFRNGIVPYQVNLIELDGIMNQNKDKFPFLFEKDEDGLSISEKIEKIISFRIPYYVGPLVKQEFSPFSWMVRKQEGKILPWNFEKMVDEDKSAEKFIRRMTNKCTYLKDQDVIAKNSLLYSKYMVLNEINKLRINGQKICVEQKQAIYNSLFKTMKKVTIKRIEKFAKLEGWYANNESIEISGIDEELKSSLGSYIDFKSFIESGKLSESNVDNIVNYLTLFSDGGKIAKRRIKEEYPQLSEEDLKVISNKKYSGWGKFSKKLLDGIQFIEKKTGEVNTIIGFMWNTNYNFMEIMEGDKFERFEDREIEARIDKLSYKEVVEPLYVSPSVKRQIWQTLKIVQELTHVMKHNPMKVFVEVTRSKEEEPKKKASRKKRLSELFNQIKNPDEETKKLIDSLESVDEGRLARQDKLYLYYTQLGRCVYSGKPIDLEEIGNTQEYDIDHIYPYSKSNDNSLENRVLVLSYLNREKTNSYPINDEIRKKMGPYWKTLHDRKLISDSKYQRLVRHTPLTEEDEKGFINRQLVETSQSTKATIEILKRYFGEETELVYSKASLVSDFRKENEFWKSRTVNSLHHAKDAYLNIVVGNVFKTKYTQSYFCNPNAQKADFNVSKLFAFNVPNAWTAGKYGSIDQVKKQMRKNDILFTRQPVRRNGQLFDLQLVKAGAKSDVLPAKLSDPVLQELIKNSDNSKQVIDDWTSKYGGYNSVSKSHLALVSHLVKKDRVITLVTINITDAKKLTDSEALLKYCIDELQLKEPKVIRAVIPFNTCFSLNGFKGAISGTGSKGKQLLFKSNTPLIISKEETFIANRIDKYLVREKEFRLKNSEKVYQFDPKIEGFNEIDVNNLFNTLYKKSMDAIYLNRPSSQSSLLSNCQDKYQNLSLFDKCRLLSNCFGYFGMGNGCMDLTLIDGGSRCGLLKCNTTFNLKKVKVAFYDISITGLYEKEIDLGL